MNSVLSVRQAYEQGKNIYDDVKNFQQQEFRLESFKQDMLWLQECVEIQLQTDIPEVDAVFVLQCLEHQVVFEVHVVENSCVITSIRYRNDRQNGRVQDVNK